MNYKTIFIVGMPRSGTKLIRYLISRHSQIAIFPAESKFIPFFYKRFYKYKDIRKKENFDVFYNDFCSTTFYERIIAKGIRIEKSEWYSKINDNSIRCVFQGLFDCYRSYSKKPIVGDKTPSYLAHIPLLNDLFPNSKIIHIYRDPRDYALSINKAWRKNKMRAVQRWKNGIRKFSMDVKILGIEPFNMKYEDLISNPRDTLCDLCEFLGIEFEENMLTIEKTTEDLGDTKGLLRIDALNQGKWVSRLRKKEVANIESIAGKLMEEMGYSILGPPGDENLGTFFEVFYRIIDGFNLLKFHISKEGIIQGLTRFRKALKHSAF
jgi:hypothetical protein